MMAKIQNLSELSQSFSFTEYDFFDFYRRSFERSELGRIKKLLPLHEMAEDFGLVSGRRAPKRGRKPYFTPEGKVALMFLKMYTQMSSPKLMEQLNGNVHYQIFCGIRINPENPLTNYKFIDNIAGILIGKMHNLGEEEKTIGGDTGYAGTANRDFCKENGIQTSFVKRGRPSQTDKEKDFVRQELARVRATTMERSFGTQKEHYSMRRIKARKKETEILYIFFGIHTANAVRLAERLLEQQRAKAA